MLTRSLFNCFQNPNAQLRELVQNLCNRRTGDVPDMSAKSTPKPGAERGGTMAHTEPSFRGEVAPQFSPMHNKSEVSSGTLELHRVERMRHTNQVGVKSTWSSPESTRSARWIVHSRGPRPACGSGFLCDAVRPHQVACATRGEQE